MTAHDWQPHVYDDRAPEALYGHPSTMRCARRGHELAARAEIGSEHSTPPYDPTAPCVGAGDSMTRTRTPTPVHPRPAPESAAAVTPDDTGSRLSVPPPMPATPPVIESAVPTERTVAIQHLAASAEKSAAASESVAHSAAAVAAQVPLVVQVLDKVFDGVAIVTLYMLARGHMLGGEIAAGMIVFVATGNNGIRALSQRAGGPAVGVAGMALLALLSVVGYAPAVAAAPVAVAVLHRASGGRATTHSLLGVMLIALFLGALTVPSLFFLAGGLR